MDEETTPQSPMNDELTRAERKKLKREQTKEERKKEQKVNVRKSLIEKLIYVLILIGILAMIFFVIKATTANAKSMDEFGKCLTSKGAVIYGNEWCSYTGRQKSMFGGSFKYLKYVICDENKGLCDEKKITITPTWEINGTMYKQVQTIETLSQISGCTIK